MESLVCFPDEGLFDIGNELSRIDELDSSSSVADGSNGRQAMNFVVKMVEVLTADSDRNYCMAV